jgi:hypothetical protein
MAQLINLTVTAIGAHTFPTGSPRTERLDLNKIKACLEQPDGQVLIEYFEPNRMKNIQYMVTQTIQQIFDLAQATTYPHGLFLAILTAWDFDDSTFPKFALLNEFSIVRRIALPADWSDRVWYDLGRDLDDVVLDLIPVNEGYGDAYGYTLGGTTAQSVEQSLDSIPCWTAGNTDNPSITIDRGGFTGTLYVEVVASDNYVASNINIPNPGVSGPIVVTASAGPFSGHVANQLQILIRDTDASGAILSDVRYTTVECVS